MNWRNADPLIELALVEDLRNVGDLTTLGTIPESAKGKVSLRLKEEGVIAGLPIMHRIFKQVDDSITIRLEATDGDFLENGAVPGHINGSMRSILMAERTVLNFIQRLSGVATLTRHYVEAVRGTKARILDTRKTAPGMRELQKYAVRCGGGENHRFGLFDMILIKDNHVDAAGSISAAITSCLKFLNNQERSVHIEVEARSLEEVKEALRFPVRRIMLDNMDCKTMSQAVRLVNGKTEIEASGNVSLSTVRDIADTGVDFISIGALTHSVTALDISLVYAG